MMKTNHIAKYPKNNNNDLKLKDPKSSSLFYWLNRAFAVALLITLVACGGDSSTDSNPDPEPEPDPTPPTEQSFNSSNISPGASFSFTFDEEAMIDYICTIHPEMQGSVTVENGAENSGQDTVIIDNLTFIPSEITIAPGTELTWVNQDNVAHTATSQ